MEEERLVSAVEAILFAAGDPVETSRIAQTLTILEKEAEQLLTLLQERYDTTGSSLRVLKLGKAWQLGTREEYAPLIRTAMEKKRMQPLSNAAMEALTIIAYNQPASKGFVERVRGAVKRQSVKTGIQKDDLEASPRGGVAAADRIDVRDNGTKPAADRRVPLRLFDPDIDFSHITLRKQTLIYFTFLTYYSIIVCEVCKVFRAKKQGSEAVTAQIIRPARSFGPIFLSI